VLKWVTAFAAVAAFAAAAAFLWQFLSALSTVFNLKQQQ